MIFKKIIIPVLSGILLLSTTSIFANSVTNNFLLKYEEKLNLIVSDYSKDVPEPLSAKIFDISHPIYYNFLKKSTKREYKDNFLAMMFYKDFKINDQQTNFCFILYDNKKYPELNKYLTQTFSNPEDVVDYLVVHELGHCFAAHQRFIGKISDEPNRYKEEQIADMFSIAYFLSKNKDKEAKIILNIAKNLPKEDEHSNYIELEKFYTLFKNDSPKINGTYDLFEKSYQYYLSINN